MALISFFLFLSSLFISNCYADSIIWQGKVSSDGSHTPIIQLIPGATYRITASGTVNLGKWVQKGEQLANDACFQFGKEQTPEKVETLKNSLNWSICQRGFQPDHIYESAPFVAAQTGVHFWIYDTDYSDNFGSLQVKVELIDTSEEQ